MTLINFLFDSSASPVAVISLAAISAVVSIVTAVLAYLAQRQARLSTQVSESNAVKIGAVETKVDVVKTTVDGKMSELLEVSRKANNLEGAERERVEQRAREEEVKT